MNDTFYDYMTSSDFAKNTDMANDLVYQIGLNFLSHFGIKNLHLITGFLQQVIRSE